MTTQLLPCDRSSHDTFRNELFASWNTTLTLHKEMIEAEEQVASGAATPERLTLLVTRLMEELKRSADLKKRALEVERSVDPLLSMLANTLLPVRGNELCLSAILHRLQNFFRKSALQSPFSGVATFFFLLFLFHQHDNLAFVIQHVTQVNPVTRSLCRIQFGGKHSSTSSP